MPPLFAILALVAAYGAVHASLGVAIPLVIIGFGLAVDFMPRY